MPGVHDTRKQPHSREAALRRRRATYGRDTPSKMNKVRSCGNVCACPMVARMVIKASIKEYDVSILRDSVVEKTNGQKKSGPATPPARVTIRATTTKNPLVGPDVISPAFLFRFFTDPEPTGLETLRRDLVGCIIGVADL